MSDVGNTLERRVRTNKEAEEIRHFHNGLLDRCPQCGRLVFQPCLACQTEIEGDVLDPFDAEPADPAILRIQLEDEERQRYEYLHLEKTVVAIHQQERKIS